jgi:uncharacterized membrane protein
VSALLRLAVAVGLTVLAAGAFSSPAIAQDDRGAYTIRNFETDLTVEANTDLLVEERIEVVFSEPRHGIFRTIPVRYSDPKGYAYSLNLRLLSVTDGDGRAQGTKVTSEGRYVKIRIGDPDRTVTGVVHYVIRYRVKDALTTFAEHDELYWNATGNEWNAGIARASVVVRLPAPVSDADLRAAAYTGAFGETGRDATVTHAEPGVIRAETTRPLGRLEGLTIAVGFPQGVVTFPTRSERLFRRLADNAVLLLPVAWFAFVYRRYRRYGRDPLGGTPVTPMYEPPPGLTPGAIGTLIDERVDTADITATVVDLAVRRYLTIRVEERDRLFGLLTHEETIFIRERPAPAGDLAPHETLVMSGLFGSGDHTSASDLANKFYKHIPRIKTSLFDQLVTQGYFDASPEKVRTRWVGLAFAAAFVTALVSFAWMVFRAVPAPAGVLVPIAAAVLTLIVVLAFSSAMPRRTLKGAQARQWALGFQEFAGRVEGDRLERDAADPRATFEALLPYALALGVAAAWARKFEGVYTGRDPAWYVGGVTTRGFSTQAFERSLAGSMSRASASMVSSPRSSSGSSGGGSSGGGGGGGGGGSW